MIVIKITNSSEVVAKKIGKFLESLTPDGMDESTIEDIVVSRLVDNLRSEGIEGEVASIRGIDLEDAGILIQAPMHVRRRQSF
ncbi:hypothetical protein KBY93_10460 [Synechococcus sp. J7-Johnson]|uniref:hypothetical protein n=1 Tax=Synechococcus sp. J7-Johnson TaxID=2823737 RepID=UPI0020CBF098|nr:hypothetical protein [Synechococcus sp. J7-Johnson]MCP9841056.1 hypothetical protein [Synechococcus sp. J7-Johnson]